LCEHRLRLTREHAERVRQLTGITLGLETYEYFLEPEQDGSPSR
jgi:chlorite dismutase